MLTGQLDGLICPITIKDTDWSAPIAEGLLCWIRCITLFSGPSIIWTIDFMYLLQLYICVHFTSILWILFLYPILKLLYINLRIVILPALCGWSEQLLMVKWTPYKIREQNIYFWKITLHFRKYFHDCNPMRKKSKVIRFEIIS